IEFIPYNKLENIKQIGHGGFSTVYSATWIDGKRIYEFDTNLFKMVLSREPCTVALKCLTGISNEPLEFFNEFKIHYECQLNRYSEDKYGIEIYGITYNSAEKEYLMVHEYADKGDLRQYLSTNFKDLDWKQKTKILCSISDNLDYIHQTYVHGDFHTKNILMISTKNITNFPYMIGDKLAVISLNIGDKINVEPKISDLGLSRKVNESTTNKEIYGVVSFSAPEIFLGNQPTKESDIYSLGVIMSEVSTGKPPFENISHQTVSFKFNIVNGLRPRFAFGTPDFYIKLAERCMDNDPMKRPTAKEVYEQFQEWEIILNKEQEKLNEDQIKIKNKFLEADRIIPTLSTISHEDQDIISTCQSISKLDISEKFNQTSKYI
ncbi:kinase-like domain-containing protein, partial [Gigaspora rosea]